ncbi:S-layer homology domain-containing protein [Aeromicrobium sp. Sec7.5]|uniref:S-layer homology domain-containing protein n=1 Tax=Aeromicrobium sp. Sec7.5 TaxID=3121276 RepID=UPI002FE44E09
MRRIAAVSVAFACALALLVPGTSASAYEAPSRSPFTDVATSATFYTQMAWLADRKISTGYANGDGTTRFDPSAPVLREQMAAFLYRLEGEPAVANLPTTSPFVDVPTTHPFYRQMIWLQRSGITTGYPDGTFRPSQPVLREQMAAFLHRMEGQPSVILPSTSPFLDVPTSHSFYRPMMWLSERGITTGYTDALGRRSFRPSQPVLREQMAAFLYRLEGVGSVPSPVTRLTASPTTSAITLGWTLPTDGKAAGVVVRRLAGATAPSTPTAGQSVADLGPAAVTVVDGGLDSLTTYSYAVFVRSQAGTYSPAASVTSTTSAAPAVAFDAAPGPTIAGVAKVGGTLTAETAAWSPSATFAYRWSADGTPITAASGRTLAVTPDLVGQQVSVAITGTSAGRITTSRESARTAPVAPGTFTTTPPVIEGLATSGSTLTATVGAWTPAATLTSLQWLRNGAPVPGRTTSTYAVTDADVGTTITVRATGSRLGYTDATATSAPVTIRAVPALANVAGTISTDAVWGPGSAKVYRVTADVTVPAGVTLTLQAGTVVKLDPGRRLQVEGTLRVDGTAASRVVLTSVRDDATGGDTNGDGAATAPAAGDFVGVSATSNGAVLMSYAQVAYADTSVSARGVAGAAPTVTLTETDISRSNLCVAAVGPVTGVFSGSVRDCSIGVSADHAFDARGVDWGSPSGPFPYGTGVPVQGASVSILPWTGFVAAPRPAVAPRQAPSTRTTCEDLVVVGVRGSGEAPASLDPSTPGVFEFEYSGFGSLNVAIAAKMAEQISVTRPDASIAYLAVQYLAVANPSFDPQVSFDDLVVSVFDGVDKLRQLLETEGARCPSSQFVLLGSSQGALVIDIALSEMTQPEQQSRIAGVVMVANPARVGASETLWESAGVPASSAVRDVTGGWSALSPGLGEPLPAWVASRTISMCHVGDVFCAFAPGAVVDRHVDYSTEELHSLAVWQGTRIATLLPPPS